MKCQMAVFKDFIEEGIVPAGGKLVSRKAAECGGDIVITEAAPLVDFIAYCSRCGVRYHQLPESGE